jgi:hypothetical protein
MYIPWPNVELRAEANSRYEQYDCKTSISKGFAQIVHRNCTSSALQPESFSTHLRVWMENSLETKFPCTVH